VVFTSRQNLLQGTRMHSHKRATYQLGINLDIRHFCVVLYVDTSGESKIRKNRQPARGCLLTLYTSVATAGRSDQDVINYSTTTASPGIMGPSPCHLKWTLVGRGYKGFKSTGTCTLHTSVYCTEAHLWLGNGRFMHAVDILSNATVSSRVAEP
jgi:hypothetical protein